MLRVRDRAGSLLGSESALRKLRFALADLGLGRAQGRHNAAPLKLNSLINEVRERLGRSPAQKRVNGSRTRAQLHSARSEGRAQNDRWWHTSLPQDNTANGLRAHGEPFWH